MGRRIKRTWWGSRRTSRLATNTFSKNKHLVVQSRPRFLAQNELKHNDQRKDQPIEIDTISCCLTQTRVERPDILGRNEVLTVLKFGSAKGRVCWLRVEWWWWCLWTAWCLKQCQIILRLNSHKAVAPNRSNSLIPNKRHYQWWCSTRHDVGQEQIAAVKWLSRIRWRGIRVPYDSSC